MEVLAEVEAARASRSAALRAFSASFLALASAFLAPFLETSAVAPSAAAAGGAELDAPEGATAGSVGTAGVSLGCSAMLAGWSFVLGLVSFNSIDCTMFLPLRWQKKEVEIVVREGVIVYVAIPRES